MGDWNAQNEYAWQYGEQRTREMHTRFDDRVQQYETSLSMGTGRGWQPGANTGMEWGEQRSTSIEDNMHWQDKWTEPLGRRTQQETQVVQGTVVAQHSVGTGTGMDGPKQIMETQSIAKGKGYQSDQERILQLEGMLADHARRDKGKPMKGKATQTTDPWWILSKGKKASTPDWENQVQSGKQTWRQQPMVIIGEETNLTADRWETTSEITIQETASEETEKKHGWIKSKDERDKEIQGITGGKIPQDTQWKGPRTDRVNNQKCGKWLNSDSHADRRTKKRLGMDKAGANLANWGSRNAGSPEERTWDTPERKSKGESKKGR